MFIFDQYPILPKLIPRFIQAKLGLAPLFIIWDQLIELLKVYHKGFTSKHEKICAGSDTTTSSFKWIILYLTKYPEMQKKVYEEIDKALPRNQLPTLLEKDKLVYTQAFINEVLRISTVTMFGLYHAFDEDFEINGYCIPKDAIVIPSIIMCHHDPDYWEDPKVFKPERFITPEGKLDINKEGFLPFFG
ncbi:hypothetical protein Avbf_15287, partial [Armadillidium vulgare]